MGCYASRRLYRRSNITQIRLANRLGLRDLHPVLKKLKELSLIIDISAGDSFSDLYGLKRFRSICASKQLAIELGIPLVLAPQAFGPFRSFAARKQAGRILESASQIWARDERSMGVVRSLSEEGSSTGRTNVGIDVAFGLPARAPERSIKDRVLCLKSRSKMLVGLNVSGLLYNREEQSARDFGLLASYREIVHEVVQHILGMPDVGLVLIGHVHGAAAESDSRALTAISARIGEASGSKVVAVPSGLGPDEIKWLIGCCDWFCGARLHSCIAALSQAVPVSAIAYSDKTLGVFERLRMGDMVFDLRKLGREDIVKGIVLSLESRDRSASRIRSRLPAVMDAWQGQFEKILQAARA